MVDWYCIHTKPNREDSICRRLTAFSDIELFSPKLRMKKYVKSRITEVREALFPAYVFLRFDPLKYFHMIKYTGGVKRFVGDCSGVAHVVEEHIIEAIKSRMVDGYVSMCDFGLEPGQKVVIMDGPFKGITGLFLSETKPRERILILLNMIESQTRVELPKELIARA